MTWIVRASLAIWGLALAIALMPQLNRPAGAEHLPGALRSLGINASVPPLQFALLIALPFLMAFALGHVTAAVAEPRWAGWAFAIALASAPVTLMHHGNPGQVILHGIAAAGIVLVRRRLEPRFTRSDIVLLPTLLALYFALLDLDFAKAPAATFLGAAVILFALRLVIGLVSSSARPALSFTAAPIAFLVQMFFFDSSPAGWLVLFWIAATPFLLMRVQDTLLTRLAACVAYPIVAFAYPLALLGWMSAVPVDVFEDSHSLLPASEMARGELPYRDIVPMHGFFSDGVLDLAAMKVIGPNLGSILRTRRVVGALSVAAIYFVALAATSSANLALLAVFLSLAMAPASSVWMRALMPLLVLACTVAGTRLRARRWFAASGALIVPALLFSLDLAIFSAIAAALGAIRARALRPFLTGLAATGAPILIVFALFGFAFDFVYASLVEVVSSGGIYIVAPLDVPDSLRTLATIVASIGDPATLQALIWFVALIGSAAVLTRLPMRARRADAVWLIGVWIILCGTSYVVRRHYYFAFALAPFIVAMILAAWRRSRPLAAALSIIIALLARPLTHVFEVATPLRQSGGVVAGSSSEYRGVPRARGAVFDPATNSALGSVQRFLASSLRPEETFYDFANAGILYYLFNRDCPVRHATVPAYQRAEAQRELIATLESNRRVRAVLLAFPNALSNIDDVPNRERAPIVWNYLQQHFQPALDENGVVFWIRR